MVRRKKPLWSAVLSQLDAKQIVTLLLALTGIGGTVKANVEMRSQAAQAEQSGQAQVAMVGDIAKLLATVDSLEARILKLEKRKPERIGILRVAGNSSGPRDTAVSKAWRLVSTPFKMIFGG